MAGGSGTSDSITGTSTTYAGGGGGSIQNSTASQSGGSGGGGTGGPGGDGTDGLGGGGGGGGPYSVSGDGGNGVVIVRAPSDFAGTIAPGTNTITTSPGPDGAAKICTFTVSGTLTGS